MKFSHHIKAALLAGALLATTAATPGHAQDIVFTEGGADLTFFYDSSGDSWDVVFRTKTGAVASGLTSPYGTPPGGVGGSADDYNFSTLTVATTDPIFRTFDSQTYLTIGPLGESPDLGVRTRLREEFSPDPLINQFGDPDAATNPSSFRMTLDWDASTKPAGAEFALWQIVGASNIVRYDTSDDDLSSDWPVYGHSHWIWGFSKPGEYELVFNFQGIDGTYGPSSIGTTSINFSVIPEPGSLLLLAAGAGLLGMRRRRTA